MNEQVMKALEDRYQAVEGFVRLHGGAQPGSVASTIVLGSLLATIVEQNEQIIGLLKGKPKTESKAEPKIETKELIKETVKGSIVHADPMVKVRYIVDNMFKNGEEKKDADILIILKENNIHNTIQELIDSKILHKTKRYMCRKG